MNLNPQTFARKATTLTTAPQRPHSRVFQSGIEDGRNDFSLRFVEQVGNCIALLLRKLYEPLSPESEAWKWRHAIISGELLHSTVGKPQADSNVVFSTPGWASSYWQERHSWTKHPASDAGYRAGNSKLDPFQRSSITPRRTQNRNCS